MQEGFIGNADTFKLFFWLCHRYKINGEAERVALLRKLVAHKRLKYARDGNILLENRNVLDLRNKWTT